MNDKLKNLREALHFVDSVILLAESDISVTIGDDIKIDGINSNSGIEDIIDEIIFRKLDRKEITEELSSKEFFNLIDRGFKFFVDDNSCFITKVTWVDVTGISRAAQMELYGKYELNTYDSFLHNFKLLKEGKDRKDINILLQELADNQIVALMDNEVGPVKNTLNNLNIEFETYRREEATTILLENKIESSVLKDYINNTNKNKTINNEDNLLYIELPKEGNALFYENDLEFIGDKTYIVLKTINQLDMIIEVLGSVVVMNYDTVRKLNDGKKDNDTNFKIEDNIWYEFRIKQADGYATYHKQGKFLDEDEINYVIEKYK